MHEDVTSLDIKSVSSHLFYLLPFSQARVTSPVETTAGAQTRTSVRSVSAQFYRSCFYLE